MPSWNSRGLRGSTLEECINLTNDKYRENQLALVQKVPTPIKPIRIDSHTRQITLAYFEQKSTVDYIGVVQGIPICFDAKECAKDNFALANIHDHQIEFMRQFEKQQGIAFLILYFSNRDYYYYLRLKELEIFLKRSIDGGKKSFAFDELTPEYEISSKGNTVFVHYLQALQQDLTSRES